MRTAFRTTSSSLFILALVAALSATAAIAAPASTDSNCPECMLVGGKGNLTGEAMGHEEANSPVSGNPSNGKPASKVADAAPAAHDGNDPSDAPEDGPLVAVDDAGPVNQPGNDKVAEAAPAADVDQDDAPDGPSKVKQKKSGPIDERNSRGERNGGTGGHSGGIGGGHNADGSPK